MSLFEQPVDTALVLFHIISGQKKDTDRDGRIGDIKGRPMIIPPVNIQKIDDGAVPKPIDQIPQRPAENPSQGKEHSSFLLRISKGKEEYSGHSGNGK